MISPSVRRFVKAQGLRATIPRCLIIQSLIALQRPVSHQELAEHLPDVEIDHSTVFRNLIALVEAGLVRRMELGDRIWRYEWIDPAVRDGQHPHFVCGSCGQILCLTDAGPVPLPASSPNFLVQDVVLRGVCPACQIAVEGAPADEPGAGA